MSPGQRPPRAVLYVLLGRYEVGAQIRVLAERVPQLSPQCIAPWHGLPTVVRQKLLELSQPRVAVAAKPIRPSIDLRREHLVLGAAAVVALDGQLQPFVALAGAKVEVDNSADGELAVLASVLDPRTNPTGPKSNWTQEQI